MTRILLALALAASALVLAPTTTAAPPVADCLDHPDACAPALPPVSCKPWCVAEPALPPMLGCKPNCL